MDVKILDQYLMADSSRNSAEGPDRVLGAGVGRTSWTLKFAST